MNLLRLKIILIYEASQKINFQNVKERNVFLFKVSISTENMKHESFLSILHNT